MSWVGLSSFPEFVVVFWIAGCCHVLRWSVVISLVCGHFLARGLWSCPEWVCGHFLRLWFISWIVVCGHVMGGAVVICWICAHFLDRGQWSCISWVGLCSSSGFVVISWIGVYGHVLGLWSFP